MQKIVTNIFFLCFLVMLLCSAMSASRITIALLDTPTINQSENANSKSRGRYLINSRFNLNDQGQGESKLTNDNRTRADELFSREAKKRSSWLMQKKLFSRSLMYKNHGQISKQLIYQVAPHAIILEIPILDEFGCADKQKLYDGLRKAHAQKVDIVHLGLQIFDFDDNGVIDQKIVQLIRSFPYVVAPAGNRSDATDFVGYPAAINGVISVGSFGKSGEQYEYSRFCQATELSPVDFLMLGENIEALVWIDEIQDYIMMPVSGTSFSAASMTGTLACILEKNQNHLRSDQIQQLLQLCSYKKDISWNRRVKYGMPALDEILLHLDELIRLKKKKIDPYFRKLRNSMSR